jgi:hypothetical protein
MDEHGVPHHDTGGGVERTGGCKKQIVGLK